MRKVRKIKARYYSREVLKYLLLAGAIYVAASSPYFIFNLSKNIFKEDKNLSKRKTTSVFNYLKKRGLIEIERIGNDVQIALTKEGKKKAGKYQIDDLDIEKPKKWDKKWRIVIFDIPQTTRLIRDVFRRKLKEWGFYRIQQSVWIIPHPCQEEIKLLRDFLGAPKEQITLFETAKLENEDFFKKIFQLK